MDETITRSAGAEHGQEMTPQAMESLLAKANRPARQRTTLYADAKNERKVCSFNSLPQAS
jgi:FO synthase